MRFEIAKVVKRMDLADYAPEYAGQVIHVWVNPPMKLLERYFELKRRAVEILQEVMTPLPASPHPEDKDGEREKDERKVEIEAIGRELMGIFAELWSQGPKGTEISAAEIEALIGVSMETDPRFYGWLQERTLALIGEHRSGLKKD